MPRSVFWIIFAFAEIIGFAILIFILYPKLPFYLALT
jgi:hypothetical protein